MGILSWLHDNTIERGKKWLIGVAIRKQIVKGVTLGLAGLAVWLAKHNIDVDVSKLVDPEVAAGMVTGLLFLVMDMLRSKLTFKPKPEEPTSQDDTKKDPA